jgi:hypothetical protein
MQPPDGGILVRKATDQPAFAVLVDGLDPIASPAWHYRIGNNA